MYVGSLILLSVLVLCGCSASHHRSTPTPTTLNHTANLTTRLELRSNAVPAGGTVGGWLIVDNESGHPIATPRCTAWEVVIANDKVPAESMMESKCGYGPVLPAGEHRYAFTATANYPCVPPPTGECGNNGSRPLPTGEYRAVLVQLGASLPAPTPVPIRVVTKP